MLEENFICNMARYTIENNATVRDTATVFKISKSTVHTCLTKRLPNISLNLWHSVQNVITNNKNERHIRGGRATKLKYKAISLQNN